MYIWHRTVCSLTDVCVHCDVLFGYSIGVYDLTGIQADHLGGEFQLVTLCSQARAQ